MPKRNLIWIAVTAAVALAAVWLARSKPLNPPAGPAGSPVQPLISLDELARRHYVDEIGPEALEGAIRGYLRGLDTYCKYIGPGRAKYLDRIIHGRRVGLGIRYEIEDGCVRVLGALPASPAWDKGLRLDDMLLAVDGEPIVEPSRELVDELLAGAEGTAVELTLRREGEEFVLPLSRGSYPIETVTGLCRRRDGAWRYLLGEPNDVAYVRIAEFADGSAHRFDEAVDPLALAGLGGLVLDLRGNPGGQLREAVSVADRFLSEGLIVMTRGRHQADERHLAHAERTLPAIRVVVLIDEGTASAPEVLAGALRAGHRAVLVGRPSFGKNVVQQPFALGAQSGEVMLTTGRYFFHEFDEFEDPGETQEPPASGPAAHPASATRPRLPLSRPIEPDVVVELSDEVRHRIERLRYRMEASPAPPITTRPVETRSSSPDADARDLQKLLRLDRQLAVALGLLADGAAYDAILAAQPGAKAQERIEHDGQGQ